MSPLNRKYNIMIICALEPDDEIKFKRFMPLFGKTVAKKSPMR